MGVRRSDQVICYYAIAKWKCLLIQVIKYIPQYAHTCTLIVSMDIST